MIDAALFPALVEQIAEHRREQRLAEIVAGGDPQRGGGTAGQLGQLAEGDLRTAPQLADNRHRRFTAGGQTHTASGALEELDPEVTLEPPDLLAHRRRGDVPLARRRRHRSRPRDGQQCLEEPPVRFELVTTHSRAGVRLVAAGDVDLAVVTGQETPRGLEERHLFDQSFVWVWPHGGRGDRTPLTERLRREPVLRLAAESRGRAVLDQYLADERIRPVSTIDVPSVSLLLSYVSGGLGIGLVPALALAEAPAARVVSAPARVPLLPVALVWRAAARRPPALTRLADLLAAAGARLARAAGVSVRRH